MIVGIGTDMIEIERVKRACERGSFLKRCYTEEEIERFGGDSVRLSGCYAVKEAVAKSFGTGFRGFEPRDIEALRDEKGKPYVMLYNGAKSKAEELSINSIHVSITNVKEYAQAFVVSEKE